MVLPRKVMFQIVYMGQGGLPEFLDLTATDEEIAKKQAADWSIRNAHLLRELGNYTVTLIKVVREFGLPDTEGDAPMQEYTVRVARNYKIGEAPYIEEFTILARTREEALKMATMKIGKNDRILSVINPQNPNDRLDQVTC